MGACPEVFLNAALEALFVIAAYLQRKIVVKSQSPAGHIEDGTLIVATIMYLHDLIAPFVEYKNWLLDQSFVLIFLIYCKGVSLLESGMFLLQSLCKARTSCWSNF